MCYLQRLRSRDLRFAICERKLRLHRQDTRANKTLSEPARRLYKLQVYIVLSTYQVNLTAEVIIHSHLFTVIPRVILPSSENITFKIRRLSL